MAGPGAGGSFTALNVTTATVVKATPGAIVTITVTTAGSTAGAAYDFAATSGYAAANLVGAIPNVLGIYSFNWWPCAVGVTIVPGTGQVLSIAYA